jgi:hypothetical protein
MKLNVLLVQKHEVDLRKHDYLLGTGHSGLVRYPPGKCVKSMDPQPDQVSGSRILNFVNYSTAIACGEFKRSAATTYYLCAVMR